GAAPIERLLPVDGHRSGLGLDPRDVEPLGRRDVHAAALPHRERVDAFVARERAALGVLHLALRRSGHPLRKALAQEVRVLPSLDEADVLTLPLVGHGEAEFARGGAHLFLGHRAEREEGLRQHLLAEAPEHVRLVLARVRRAEERRPPLGVGPTARIVPGRDVVAAKRLGAAHQLAELEPVVALHAGIGRAPLQVLADEVVDDVRLEVVLEIEDVVRESHPARHGAAVVDGLERAAAAARRRTLRVAPELHGDADDRVSGALQERRGNARVDAAAHRDEHGRLAGGSEVVHGKSQDANDGEPARSFFTTSGTTSSTRSMSAEVVERPRLNRTADWAMFAGTPMPRRTCDAWDDPALHAEPALQAKPFMSSDRIRCSPSAPTNERW